MKFTLDVFTLNCWGIPVISKNRKERFEAIGKYLAQSSHTIVCLQEVWSENDYLYLKGILKTNLPYSHYFYSGVLGSGLCVFSKWLIQDVFFHQWPLNGYIHKVHHGDWFGGKGVGLCRIRCGSRLINVYCTHLHAEYHVDDIYLAHRVLQAYAAAQFVSLTMMPADVSILAGDLNTAPGEISFKIISQLPPLLDPCDNLTDESNTTTVGTSDAANNSYSDPKQVRICPEGKRIDHILYRLNPGLEAEILNFGNPLPDRIPGKEFSYSDHNAVSLVLQVKTTEDLSERSMPPDHEFIDTTKQAIKICREAMSELQKSKALFLTSGGLILMFLIGTVGFWPNRIYFDVIKLVVTGLCFYNLMMGTLWNSIEMNSLKATLGALEKKLVQTEIDLKGGSGSGVRPEQFECSGCKKNKQ